MTRAVLAILCMLWLSIGPANSQVCSALTTLSNGTTADANVVNSNFTTRPNCINNNSVTSPVPPQGRLTLTSNTPVMTGDVTGATTVCYTPYVGSLVPIYNGGTSKFVMSTFAQLSAALNNQVQIASNLYDVSVFSNSGVVTMGFGPSWASGRAARTRCAARAQIR